MDGPLDGGEESWPLRREKAAQSLPGAQAGEASVTARQRAWTVERDLEGDTNRVRRWGEGSRWWGRFAQTPDLEHAVWLAAVRVAHARSGGFNA